MIQTPPYTQVTAGNPLTDPIVINEVDQYGNIETTDNSTVVTASQASGAGSLKGIKTATVSGGVASFDDLENDTAGALTLQFSAASLPPVISAPSTVMPAAATHLVITQPPAGITAGAPFGADPRGRRQLRKRRYILQWPDGRRARERIKRQLERHDHHDGQRRRRDLR